MRVSVSITHYPDEDPAARLAHVGRMADEGGLDTVWVGDHVRQVAPGSDPTDPMLEAGTVLGFLAAVTTRVRLGMMVGALPFRPPSVLVKAVTTLDVLSGGRAWFGVGIGHDAAEAAASDIPFPPAAQRYARLEETLALARRMWSGDARPVPTTRPHPPILVGGHGEKRTLPWWRGTPMRATCSTSPTVAQRYAASWPCSTNCVSQPGGHPRTWSARSTPGCGPGSPPLRSPTAAPRSPRWTSTTSSR